MSFDVRRFCYLTYQQLLRLALKEERDAARRAYRDRYCCEIAMHKQLLRLAFPKEARAADKKRRDPNHPNYSKRKVYLRESNKKWRKRFPERAMAGVFKYQARKRAARFGDRSAVKAIYKRAAELRRYFDVVVDHIIPFTKGGLDCAENLQIIYRFDNEKKGTLLDYRPCVIFK
jgi:hypothetical protein